jgi:hypothetical protein
MTPRTGIRVLTEAYYLRALLSICFAASLLGCSPHKSEHGETCTIQLAGIKELHGRVGMGYSLPTDATFDQTFTIRPSRWIGLQWITPKNFPHPLPNLAYLRSDTLGTTATAYKQASRDGWIDLKPDSEFGLGWRVQHRMNDYPGLKHGDRVWVAIGREDPSLRGEFLDVYAIVEIRCE